MKKRWPEAEDAILNSACRDTYLLVYGEGKWSKKD